MDAVMEVHANEASAPVPCSCQIGPRAEKRIKQLLKKNKDLDQQLAYMQEVTALMMPLVPKSSVSEILEKAARNVQTFSNTKGNHHV